MRQAWQNYPTCVGPFLRACNIARGLPRLLTGPPEHRLCVWGLQVPSKWFIFCQGAEWYCNFYSLSNCKRDRRWCSWLRHCAIDRKVAGSIPDGVIWIIHWHNPSGRTMALGSTQPLPEISTRNISWGGKGGQCFGLTTLPPSCADFHEIWELQPPGTLRACPDLYRDCSTLTFTCTK